MKNLIYILLITVPILLSACSQEKEIDINQLSSEILQNVNFSDELVPADAATIQKLYHIDNAVNQAVYLSSGATAEEIAVFEFETNDAAVAAMTEIQKRLENQKESYQSYMPKEIQKLENAIMKQSGRYVIFCVSEGTEAEKILNKYL